MAYNNFLEANSIVLFKKHHLVITITLILIYALLSSLWSRFLGFSTKPSLQIIFCTYVVIHRQTLSIVGYVFLISYLMHLFGHPQFDTLVMINLSTCLLLKAWAVRFEVSHAIEKIIFVTAGAFLFKLFTLLAYFLWNTQQFYISVNNTLYLLFEILLSVTFALPTFYIFEKIDHWSGQNFAPNEGKLD